MPYIKTGWNGRRKKSGVDLQNACIACMLAASFVVSLLPMFQWQSLPASVDSDSTCVGLRVIADDGGSVSGDEVCGSAAASSSEASSENSSSSTTSLSGQTPATSATSSAQPHQQSENIRGVSLVNRQRAKLRLGGVGLSQEGKTILDPYVGGTVSMPHAAAPTLPNRLCTSMPFSQVLPQCRRLVRRMVRVEKNLQASPLNDDIDLEDTGLRRLPEVHKLSDPLMREDDSVIRRFLRGLLRLLRLIDE